jgi:hypothetical protein
MAGATSTTLAAAVGTFVSDLVNTADYIGSPLRDLIPEIQSPGGTTYRWNVKYGDNAASVDYAEGDAVGADGNTLSSQAYVAYSTGYVRTPYSITGHALDACKNGYWDVVAEEAKSALASHIHAKEGKCVTAVEAAIEDDSTYAGLTRATVKMASYSPSAIGTLALSDLNTLWTTLQTDPLIAPVDKMVFLSGITVQNAYAAVAAGVAYNEFNQQRGLVMDAGKLTAGLSFNGRPFKLIPTMTDGTLIFVEPENLLRVVHRPITVKELAVVDDSVRFVIESCEITICKSPKFAAKLVQI